MSRKNILLTLQYRAVLYGGKFLFAQSQISELAVDSFRHLRHGIMSQIRWSKREVRGGLEGRWEGGVTHWSPSNYCLSRSGVGDRVWMEIVTWPEQTNNIAGCKTPSPLSFSPLQKKSIGTGSKFPEHCLGLGEAWGGWGRGFVFAHYRPFLSLLLIIESLACIF